MKQIFTFVVLTIFTVGAIAQNAYFKAVSPSSSEFCPFKDSADFCVNLKAIFIDDNAKLLINKGMPEFDEKVKKNDVVDVVGFSQQKYKEIDGADNMLPYVKIKKNNKDFWVFSKNTFIFSGSKPVVTVVSQGVTYNFFLARSLFFEKDIDGKIYPSIEILVGENTKTGKYFLSEYDKYPNQLQGHSVGIKYFYLQNDDFLSEKIIGYETEKHFIVLKIKAKYADKTANYQVIIFPTYKPVRATFSSISFE